MPPTTPPATPPRPTKRRRATRTPRRRATKHHTAYTDLSGASAGARLAWPPERQRALGAMLREQRHRERDEREAAHAPRFFCFKLLAAARRSEKRLLSLMLSVRQIWSGVYS